MRCRYCQTTTNLCTEVYEDEDGFASDEVIDLCRDCLEHSEARRKAREEWCYYHDMPCPEIELPQPAPKRASTEGAEGHDT